MAEFSDIFRIANLAVALIMILGGAAKIFSTLGYFAGIILGAYCIVFGLGIALLEFQIPAYMQRYASFLFSFLGRGIFYVFIGSVLLDSKWYNNLDGAIIGIVGVAYLVLEFIPSIEPPANMREADAGWGAEQV